MSYDPLSGMHYPIFQCTLRAKAAPPPKLPFSPSAINDSSRENFGRNAHQIAASLIQGFIVNNADVPWLKYHYYTSLMMAL